MKKDNKSADLAIELVNISKKYSLHHEKPTLAEQFISPRKKEEFIALNNINLKIKKGEKIGIIGPNGSGKTTLLKIIAGITTPTQGKISTRGKVVSLIDLEAGFHPELTGEENIFLNGMVIGMSKSEIELQLARIIAFADIGNFIDAPLYTYSEGMKLRLGFSIAVHANPDILILDEGLTVGDQDFQRKSGAKIEEFFNAKKTILVVTHWQEFLEKHCQRIVLVDKSKISADGGHEVLRKYRKKILL